MALTRLEKALATALGLEILKPGTNKMLSKKALEASFVALVKGGQMLGRAGLPVAARALPPVARAVANPYVGVPLGLAAATYGTQQYLDESGMQEQINEAQRQAALRYVGETEPAIREFARSTRKKPKTAFNRAVSSAMKAVKASKFQGKKGTLSSPKRTFSMVSKTVSKVAKGGKVASKGATGVIKRAVIKILPKPRAKTIRGGIKRALRGYK